jgi:hypothetical protein
MPDQRRADKTTDKTRRGGLPAATHDAPVIGVGDGAACDGCGETITPLDQRYEVSVRGVLPLRFHGTCYNAWVTFKREAGP